MLLIISVTHGIGYYVYPIILKPLALEFAEGIRRRFGPDHYHMEMALDLLTDLYSAWGQADKAEEYRALKAALPSDEEPE